MNENTTQNSTSRILALGVTLTIGVWLVILLTGKQTEENPTTAKATPPQPKVKEKAKAIDGFDAAAEFREWHNRALSPEAREDNRRKLWEQNFPFKPTYDPAVTVTADMISDDPKSRRATDNHFFLKHFFESEDAKELRFSPQFEQLYRIMEKYDRTENPVALGWAFETLRQYHHVLREDPNEVIKNSDGTPVKSRKFDGSWGTITYREEAEDLRECIGGEVDGRNRWPHKEPMHHTQVESIVERLINEIPGMADLGSPLYGKSLMVGVHDVDDPLPRKTLKVGDPLLTPYAGYQAGYDAWNDERNRAINEGMAKKRRKNLPTGILADGTLVNANNEPIQAGAGSLGSFVNFGKAFDLQEMEDGSVRLSPEAMAILDAEFGKQERPLRPPVLGNPAPTEEEWRLQEAMRQQDEEGARHQQRHLEELGRQRQQEYKLN